MKQNYIYLAGILLAIVLIAILGLGIAKADVALAENTAQRLSVVPCGHQPALESKVSKPLLADKLLDLLPDATLFAKAAVEKEVKLDGLAKLHNIVKPQTPVNVNLLAVDESLLSAVQLTDSKAADLNVKDLNDLVKLELVKLEKVLVGKPVKDLRSDLVENYAYVKNNTEKPSLEGMLYSSPTFSSLV